MAPCTGGSKCVTRVDRARTSAPSSRSNFVSIATSPSITASTAASKRATGEPGVVTVSTSLGQALPVGKVVPASECQRCILARDWRRADFLVREVTLEPWNFGIEELRMSSPKEGDCLLVTGLPSEEEHVGLLDVIRERRVVHQVRNCAGRPGVIGHWRNSTLASEQRGASDFYKTWGQDVRIVAAKEDNS